MIDVPRGTRRKLDELRALVLAENARQNLISVASIDDIEARHIVDSLQLLKLVGDGTLLDIGTGAGFPGLVLACCRSAATHLVEPRAKRAAFLVRAAEQLDIAAHTIIWQSKVERISLPPVDVITARAVASLNQLFAAAASISGPHTRWVLPKGRSAQSELDAARISWHGDFEIVSSATDADSGIVLARNVHRR